MRTIVFAATVLSGLLACAAAHAQSSKLPAVVAADLKAIAAECTDVGAKAITTEAVKRVDLNGDGNEDYVLYVGWINCEGAAGIYGDREMGVTVYVGDGKGGATSAFQNYVYGAAIEGTGPATKLSLTVSGQQCGKKPAPNFASENFCYRSIVWNAKTRKFDYAPVSTVKMIQ